MIYSSAAVDLSAIVQLCLSASSLISHFYSQSIPKMMGYVPGTCGACGEPIVGDHISAFMMQWHLDHLLCNICGKDFSDGTQVCEGIDGFAYCPEDWQKVRWPCLCAPPPFIFVTSLHSPSPSHFRLSLRRLPPIDSFNIATIFYYYGYFYHRRSPSTPGEGNSSTSWEFRRVILPTIMKRFNVSHVFCFFFSAFALLVVLAASQLLVPL